MLTQLAWTTLVMSLLISPVYPYDITERNFPTDAYLAGFYSAQLQVSYSTVGQNHSDVLHVSVEISRISCVTKCMHQTTCMAVVFGNTKGSCVQLKNVRQEMITTDSTSTLFRKKTTSFSRGAYIRHNAASL